MRHFLFVGDSREVLGVWEVRDELEATKLNLKLALMYPGCRTVADRADDFESFKSGYSDYDFDGWEPDTAQELLDSTRAVGAPQA